MKKRNQDAEIGIDRGWEILSLDEMCARWNESHESAFNLQQSRPESILAIKYNDLTINPGETFETISKYLGVSNQFDYSAIKRNNPRMFLNQDEQDYIKEKTAHVAQKFGYQI